MLTDRLDMTVVVDWNVKQNNEIKNELFSEVGLGKTCTFADSCNDTNASCSSGKCVCMHGYFDDNADESGGICIHSNYFIIILPMTLDCFYLLLDQTFFILKLLLACYFLS